MKSQTNSRLYDKKKSYYEDDWQLKFIQSKEKEKQKKISSEWENHMTKLVSNKTIKTIENNC